MHLLGVKLAIPFSYSLHVSYFFNVGHFLIIYLSIFNRMLVFLNILISILVCCISKFEYQNFHYFGVILNVFQGIFTACVNVFSDIESRHNLGSSKTIYIFVLTTCI